MAALGALFGVLVMVINAVVSRNGVTLLFRGPNLPWWGEVDITWEALAYGAILGARMFAIFATAVFLGAAVDADELLRGLRRVSLRSGVTAALAMRLWPVLARDGHRLADAQRCLPDGGASRVAVLRAVTAGALDRATDVAATLEVRGFASARRPPRMPRPWSRHDLAFAASAAGLAAHLARRPRRAVGRLRALSAHLGAARRADAGPPWRRSRSSRWPRSPTAGGSDDPRARPGHLHVSGRDGAGPGGRVAGDRAGRARAAGRRVGLGQVDAAARRLRARPALPRRDLCRARPGRRARHARARAGRRARRWRERCSRTPRPRS